MSTGINVRGEALNALLMIMEQSRPSHLVIREALETMDGISRQERAFFTRLCEGCLERRLHLDYVLEQCSSVPVRKMKPVIRTILRMAVYQIIYMDSVPDTAACNEAVRLAGKRGFNGLKGYVNAVLRMVCRQEPEKRLPKREDGELKYLEIAYSAPVWLIELLVAGYGAAKAEAILRGYFTEQPLTVRLNLSRIHAEGIEVKDIRAMLEAEGVRTEEIDGFSGALYLHQSGDLKRLSAMQRGFIQVQDIASMLPVFAAQVKPGETVIDVCAAPGGKSLHAADVMADQGRIISRDLTESKIALIRDNLRRSQFTCIEPQVYDAVIFDPELEEKADVVIADLPCSGLGIIGKKPDIRYRMDRGQIIELAALQKQILSVVRRYVRPGGRLIFSTCTLSDEENRQNREWFLQEFAEFSPFPLTDMHFPRFGEPSTGEGYIQLLPGIHSCDGFFVAAFIKN